jgi:hypothetical protein
MATDDELHGHAGANEQDTPARIPPAVASSVAPIRLTEHELDPLNNLALKQELPGITAAFDEQHMCMALETVLFESNNHRSIIERCEVDQATYVPGECVILRYMLSLKDEQTNQIQEVLVSGRLFPNQPACDAYIQERLWPLVAAMSGRAEIAPFAVPVGVIEDLHMAVHVWPLDGDIPSLMGATDSHRLVPILNEVLPALQGRPFTVTSCEVELVDYGRQHRATLRYHVTGRADNSAERQQLIVYGKLTGDGSGAMAETISRTIRERVQTNTSGYRFNVPLALPWQPVLKLSLLEALPGEALISDQLKARLRDKPTPAVTLSLEEMIDACAHIAATLHTSSLDLGPRRTLDDELAILGRGVANVQRVAPELGALLADCLDRIAQYAARTEPLPLCFNHGDFTYGQILFDGAMCGLIDFDSVCQAEPALDLGQFLTYVRVASLKSKLTPLATKALMAQLSERFLDTYTAATGDGIDDPTQLRARVSIYRMISLLRRSLRSWQKFKPGRIASALAVLEEALVELPSLPS